MSLRLIKALIFQVFYVMGTIRLITRLAVQVVHNTASTFPSVLKTLSTCE